METERLYLLPWQAGDEPLLGPIASDPMVMRYITGGAPWGEEQIRSFVARQVALYSERGLCRWRLQRKDTGETIGFTGLGRMPGLDDLELGWWLGRTHWGRGYATEAAQAALHDAFERCRLARIISITVPENLASQGVMRRLGLAYQGRIVHAGLEHLVYGAAREPWCAQAGLHGPGGAG